MGLDMYLYKNNYVKQWDFDKPEDRYSVIVKKGGKKVDNIDPKKIAYVVEEVGYWRKVNAIHKWFIDNCANGDNDRTQMNVDREQLEKLLETVKEVLDNSKLVAGKVENGYSFDKAGNKVPFIEDGQIIEDPSVAKRLLPSESGFFFGGTDYDEYYYHGLVQTKEILENVLADPDADEFSYHASW